MSHIKLNINENVSAIQKPDSHYFRKWILERMKQIKEEQREQSAAAFVGSASAVNIIQLLSKDTEVIWREKNLLTKMCWEIIKVCIKYWDLWCLVSGIYNSTLAPAFLVACLSGRSHSGTEALVWLIYN